MKHHQSSSSISGEGSDTDTDSKRSIGYRFATKDHVRIRIWISIEANQSSGYRLWPTDTGTDTDTDTDSKRSIGYRFAAKDRIRIRIRREVGIPIRGKGSDKVTKKEEKWKYCVEMR